MWLIVAFSGAGLVFAGATGRSVPVIDDPQIVLMVGFGLVGLGVWRWLKPPVEY